MYVIHVIWANNYGRGSKVIRTLATGSLLEAMKWAEKFGRENDVATFVRPLNRPAEFTQY